MSFDSEGPAMARATAGVPLRQLVRMDAEAFRARVERIMSQVPTSVREAQDSRGRWTLYEVRYWGGRVVRRRSWGTVVEDTKLAREFRLSVGLYLLMCRGKWFELAWLEWKPDQWRSIDHLWQSSLSKETSGTNR